MYPRLLLHGVVLLPVWKRCRQIRLRRYGRLHRRAVYYGFWYFSTNSSIGVGARKTMTSRVSSG
jgi:hypothetical protein